MQILKSIVPQQPKNNCNKIMQTRISVFQPPELH